MTDNADFRLTAALQDFIEENNIGNDIKIDAASKEAYVFFDTGSKFGKLQSSIQIDENNGYIMIYLIDFQHSIIKDKKSNALEKINEINLETKIGCFQLFNYEDSEYIRFYLGFPADDVSVNETVIYNLFVECIQAFELRGNDLVNF